MAQTGKKISGQWDVVGQRCKRKIHYMFSKEGKERSRAEAMSENLLLLLYIRRTKGPDPSQRKGHQIKPS
jgi:hypothetical protein